MNAVSTFGFSAGTKLRSSTNSCSPPSARAVPGSCIIRYSGSIRSPVVASCVLRPPLFPPTALVTGVAVESVAFGAGATDHRLPAR